MTAVLSVFECASIQPFVFGSSRLQENLGASHLVYEALEQDLLGHLPDDALAHWQGATQWRRDAEKTEVLYVGGGNAIVCFPSLEDALSTTRSWSRALLEKAPGLRPVAAHVPYEQDEAGLPDTLDEAFRRLDRVKRDPPAGWKLQCLPVTRHCSSTGLAAGTVRQYEGEEPQWLSTEAQCKREARHRAEERMRKMFDQIPLESYALTDKLDELSREGEPHIAVIHIDGNGIGKLLMEASRGGGDDAETARNLQGFSQSVTEVTQRALAETLAELRESLSTLNLKLPPADGKEVFPVRPVVFGGDDIALVSNGKLGLGLAARYLRALDRSSSARDEPLSACAGVAIVRSHFPFSRAYELADDLCRQAKQRAREEGGSWLDFHIVMSGATGNLAGIREPYQVGERHLLWRPWRVVPDEGSDHDWSLMEDMVHVFGKWPRWRTKELRDSYQLRGPVGVSELITQYESRGIAMPKIHEVYSHTEGFAGYETAYLDGLEAQEFLPW